MILEQKNKGCWEVNTKIKPEPHHNKGSKLMKLLGCYKNPQGCDSCKVPVENCYGNLIGHRQG